VKIRNILIMMLSSHKVRTMLTDHCYRKDIKHEPLKKLNTALDDLDSILKGKEQP
jgi:flagellar basal body-associated protein FliL